MRHIRQSSDRNEDCQRPAAILHAGPTESNEPLPSATAKRIPHGRITSSPRTLKTNSRVRLTCLLCYLIPTLLEERVSRAQKGRASARCPARASSGFQPIQRDIAAWLPTPPAVSVPSSTTRQLLAFDAFSRLLGSLYRRHATRRMGDGPSPQAPTPGAMSRPRMCTSRLLAIPVANGRLRWVAVFQPWSDAVTAPGPPRHTPYAFSNRDAHRVIY